MRLTKAVFVALIPALLFVTYNPCPPDACARYVAYVILEDATQNRSPFSFRVFQTAIAAGAPPPVYEMSQDLTLNGVTAADVGPVEKAGIKNTLERMYEGGRVVVQSVTDIAGRGKLLTELIN